ncbi:ABC transporter substrate-binding protein [Millisia brevis]|uniref:ABC transporter substrate-binding protein n=1 Tax=Millisia brevis TaxID=264148 RepID=UPI00082C05F0|nr:ABC transporter substrate-binding protein [Millisia brevis]
MSRRALAALALAMSAALGLTACSSGSSDSASTTTDAADDGYVTPGRFTVGTGEPAYFPWVIDDDPSSGEGFESAVAYAVADQLGFEPDQVDWVRTTFDSAIAPGPKDFDVNLQQFSIREERRQFVDFSSPYYVTTQVVVTREGSPAAGATSLADLRDVLIGAQSGTTSFLAAERAIDPTRPVAAFNNNDDVKVALETGQVDAVVFDLPTAFYVSSAELTGGIIVGQLPEADGEQGDELGFVLPKDSPLTGEVTAAVDTLRENGTLDQLADQWLGGDGVAPVLS